MDSRVFNKIKKLEIRARKTVSSTMSGAYRSAFKGQGLLLSDFREYVAGDDVRNISWNLIAKTGKVFIKQFTEERELNILLALDMSASMQFNHSASSSKKNSMLFLSALLGLSALQNNDKVGLVLFTDEIEKFIPAKKGRNHILHLLSQIESYQPVRQKTNMEVLPPFIMNSFKQSCIIFLISDFLDAGFSFKEFYPVARKHDTVALHLETHADLDNLGLVCAQHMESHSRCIVDTSTRSFQKLYTQKNKEQRSQLKQSLRKQGVDYISFAKSDDLIKPLNQFFNRRKSL